MYESMKMLIATRFVPRSALFGAIAGAALLAGCGGGGDPLSNPGNVTNPVVTGGAQLAFPYFEKCIFPIFLKPLPIVQNGVSTTNTCSSWRRHSGRWAGA